MGKRSRRRQRQARTSTPLPKNVIRAFRQGATVAQELQAGASPEEAIAQRRSDLLALLEPIDAVHLLGQVLLAEVPIDAGAYKESDHPGSAFVVEMIGAEMVRRPSREGTQQSTPPIDGRVLGEARRLTQETVFFETFRRYRGSGAFDSPEGAARGRAAAHHLMLRGPGWPWQEHETLRGIFGPDHLANRLKSKLGFDVEDAISCSEAISRLLPERMGEHMLAAKETVAEFSEDHPAYRWAVANLGGWGKAPAAEQALYLTGLWAMNHIGDAFLVDADALAARAEVEVPAAAAFLAALAQPVGQEDADWIQMAERIRNRPFIDFGDDGYFLTVPGNDLWALRGVFEAELKSDKAYTIHRGRWLEQRAAHLLAGALDPDEAHGSVEFTFEDENGEQVEGEIDALLRCGDAALIVEAKSATLRPGARRGGEALLTHLRDNLTRAAEQGARARNAFARSANLQKDGTTLQLGSAIREVHPIVVTLDDLSAVAPVLWQLEGSRVMPGGVTLPWVVTLHELDLVCQTVEWPAQFVHFLRRRSRLNVLGGRIASDELDWWMHYLFFGLYFEEDTEQMPVRFTSLTDPLDAWVLQQRGLRDAEAPKPAMRLDDKSRAFIDLLCLERPDAWVAAACTFLEMSGESRKRLWKDVKRMRRRAVERTKIQRGTLGFSEAPEPMLVCVVVVPEGDRTRVPDYLGHYVHERLDEFGDQRVLGIGVSTSSQRPYDALVVYERSWWESPAAVAEAHG